MGQRVIYVNSGLVTRELRQGQLHARSRVLLGLPADAKYVRCFDHSTQQGMIGLVFESREWIPAQEGSTIPAHEITFQNES